MDIMLLHDSHNEFYRTPSGPAPAGSNVLIRLHCDEATSVVLRTWMTEELCYTMLPTAEHVWEVAIPLPTTPGLFWYYFLIYRKDGRTIRYGNQPDKLGGVGVAYDHGEPESFQITLYDPAYKTPEAFHGANIYQIFPDRFRHAPTKAVDDRKDRYVHQNWDEELLCVGDLRGGKYQELDFYGGTLTGIQEKLPYLKDMGIDIIYLNPIFRARSNHRYDTGNYTQVDPLCGTNTEFTELCGAAKKVGIRVMLDGVFSHTGEDSVYFNHFGHYPTLGAYQGQSSPYYDWYTFNHYPEDYKAWWGILSLPELRKDNPEYQKFMFQPHEGVVPRWIEAGSCGWRLDVADELPDAFIEKIRTAVKRVSPEKFLLGEVWEDATTKFGFDHRRTYLLGKGLDSVMNYPFKNSVLDFVKGKPAQQAANEILSICEHYPAPAINTALNFLSTHDTERALTVIADEPANGRGREWQSGRSVTGEAYEEGMLRLRMAYAIIYTLPGVPCLYYGDEIGMQGYRDPFNRAFFCWDSHEERLRPVLAQLAQLRHSCEAFRTGELRVLRAEDGILHYQRIGKTETAEIIVNRSEHIIVEPLASGKHTEVNPMGFTIVVEENGHNPNHSYYDIQ